MESENKPTIDVGEHIERVKLIVSEVDGVITDGNITFDALTNTPFKSFNMKDLEAINELKKGFTFVFISSDNSISYHLFQKKNIPFFWAPKNKKKVLGEILNRYKVTPDEVLYIGSTYSDIECMNIIPFSLSPDGSVEEVYERSIGSLNVYGGDGVIVEVYNLLKQEIIRRKACS